MNTRLAMTTERALQIYSADISEWWDGAGDTDQTLGAREWLGVNHALLHDDELSLLEKTDDKVLRKISSINSSNSFDAVMLKRIGKFIMEERRIEHRKAA